MTAALPEGACDCHVHVVGPAARFPFLADRPYTPADATYAMLQERMRGLGIDRTVIVQPSFYGTDNRCTLDALAQFGPTARGVAVEHIMSAAKRTPHKMTSFARLEGTQVTYPPESLELF